jgi:ABC-2 type transport system permease protein
VDSPSLVRRRLDRAGIDARQWQALVVTAIRMELRTGRGSARGASVRGLAPIAGLLLVQGMAGMLLGGFVYRAEDLLLGAAVFLTYVSFAVLLTIVLDFHSVVTSPDDYAVLGFRPVSSRTYFAARLTNVLLVVAVLCAAIGAGPVAAYIVRGGPIVGLAAIAASAGTAIATALAAILLYAWLVVRIPRDRLTRIVSYLQLALSAGAYSSVLFVPRLLEGGATVHLVLPRTPWLHVHPAMWFARYIEIAAGTTGLDQILPAAATVVLLGALLAVAAGRLSLDYAARLGELTVARTDAPARKRSRRSWWFTRDEERAVALLVRAQFRHDQKFRLAVLGILPITFFYVLMGIQDRTLTDPFSGDGSGHPALVYYGALLFPVMLHMNLTRSDAYHSAWIFYVSPSSPTRIVRAMKNYLMATIVVPYVALLSGVFAWYFEVWWHVAVHGAVLLLFAHVMLLFAVTLDPEMPFARPVRHGERTAHIFVTFLVASLLGAVAIPLAARYLYRSPARIAVLFAGLAALNLAMDVGLRVRLRRLQASAEFAG